MDMSANVRRQAFSIWLRTGRWPRAQLADGVELKFNPWHDPENGRFTFAGSGRDFCRQDGGAPRTSREGFGGAGATGSWERTKRAEQRLRRSSLPDVPRPHSRLTGASPPVSGAPARTQPASAEKFKRIVRNGYEYHIDSRERTRRVSGTLTLNTAQPRSRTAQARAGGPERRASDDGGHYIARRFNGPTDAFNHFAQNANFNRGGYRVLEDQWARAKREGKNVVVTVIPRYDGVSQRPWEIDVRFMIDGMPGSLKFPNERQETVRAQR